MKRFYVDIPEGQMHYQTEGSGPPLLLVHQTRMSSDEYSEMIPLLAKRYRVFAVDLLGHGPSDRPPAEFTIEDHARSLVHFLDATGVKMASIVGHHVGSRVAVETAATWPERVDRLVLSGCAYYTPEEREVLPKDPKYSGLDVTLEGEFLSELWRRYKANFCLPVSSEVLCRVVAISLVAMAKPYNIHEAVFKHDIDRPLRRVKCPTLFVSGDKDVFYNKLDLVKKLVPGSQTRVIPGGGYFVCLEKPEEFAQVIRDFVT